MRSRLAYGLWVATALLCGSVLASEEIRWSPDLPTARKAATQYNVPLLIHFYGDNCLPCKTLEQRVLNQPELIATLNKYFICVRINATQDRRTAAEYQVHSWPTDVFLGADGKVLHQGVCKQDPAGYMSVLQNVAVLNRDRNVLLAAQQSDHAGRTTTNTVAYPGAASNTPGANGQLPNASIHPQVSAGPGFYAAQQVYAAQQAPASPNAPSGLVGQSPAPQGVIAGPMHANSSPQAITTATQLGNSQIAGASQAVSLHNGHQMLPPVVATARLEPPAFNRTTSDPLAQYPSMPQTMLGMKNNLPLVETPTSNSASASSNTPASNSAPLKVSQAQNEFVSNPYYEQPTAPDAQSVARQAGESSQQQVASSASPQGLQWHTQGGSKNTMPSTTSAEVTARQAGQVTASTVAFQPRSAPATSMDAQNVALQEKLQPALRGYCPVTLKQQGTWIKGKPEHTVRHRGKLYLLNSPQAVNEFLAAPDACSPILSGFDPMVFLNEGRLVEGSMQHGLHEQRSGAILLFATAENKQAYEQQFDRYTQALDAVLKQANGPNRSGK